MLEGVNLTAGVCLAVERGVLLDRLWVHCLRVGARRGRFAFSGVSYCCFCISLRGGEAEQGTDW